jgi:hypothetical protein
VFTPRITIGAQIINHLVEIGEPGICGCSRNRLKVVHLGRDHLIVGGFSACDRPQQEQRLI